MLTHKEKQEILNELSKSLQLAGVFLSGGQINLNSNLEVGDPLEGKRQNFKALTSIAIDKMDNDEESVVFRYRIKYKMGIRYVNNELEDDDEDFVLIEIAAEFEAQYFSDEELDEEEIKVFSGLNVPHNIWPYWCEYVQNTCSRMGFPPLTVPFQTELQDLDV